MKTTENVTYNYIDNINIDVQKCVLLPITISVPLNNKSDKLMYTHKLLDPLIGPENVTYNYINTINIHVQSVYCCR